MTRNLSPWNPVPISWHVIGLAVLVGGCATIPSPPMLVQSTGSYRVMDLGFKGRKVLILRPQLGYRDVQTEKELPGGYLPYENVNLLAHSSGAVPTLGESEAMAGLMVSHARTILSLKGFEVVADEELTDSDREKVRRPIRELADRSEQLLKLWDKDKDQRLKHLAFLRNALGVDGVLVQVLDVKFGQAPTWDFVASGRMTAGTSRTTLKAGLVEAVQGEMVWEREVFYRNTVHAESLKRMLALLFQSFPECLSSNERTKNVEEISDDHR